MRNSPLHLCHMVWMGNHAHVMVVSKDAQDFSQFIADLKRETSMMVKQLLARTHLNLWVARAMVAEVLDPTALLERLTYFYTNPQTARLCPTIEQYPGLNTWTETITAPATPDAVFSTTIPWIRRPFVTALSCSTPSRTEQLHEIARYEKLANQSHQLVIEPNKPLAALGITEPEQIEAFKIRLIQQVYTKQEELQKKYAEEKLSFVGIDRLISTQIMHPHQPDASKNTRRPFILCSIDSLRVQAIRRFKDICAEAAELYQRTLKGERVPDGEWPAGVFRPPLRHASSALYSPEWQVM